METPKDEAIVSPLTPKRDFTEERDQEVIPVVRELLKRLAAREDLLMGSSKRVDQEKAALYYQEVYQEDIIPLLMEHNIKLTAISYVFSLMLQPLQLLKDVTMSSFGQNQDIADAIMYGVKDIDDLRVQDLDKVLRGVAKESEQSEVVDK